MHYITERDMVGCIKRDLLECKEVITCLKVTRVITEMHLLTPAWTIVNQPGSLNQHRVFHLLIGDMWVNKTEHVQVQVQAEQEEQEDSLSALG